MYCLGPTLIAHETVDLRKAAREELELKHTPEHVDAMFQIANMSEKELCMQPDGVTTGGVLDQYTVS